MPDLTLTPEQEALWRELGMDDIDTPQGKDPEAWRKLCMGQFAFACKFEGIGEPSEEAMRARIAALHT
jgi:hypothetical protein